MAAGRPGGDRARWLRRFRPGGPCDVRLFCFHHAGGTASRFRGWANQLPRSIEPVALQLPGRGDRLQEPPFETMEPLLDTLVEVVRPMLDQEFVFYGLSMGAKVAWALAHSLREHGMTMPSVLYLASAAAPGLEESSPDGKDDLVGYLRDMGGTPPEIFSQPDLLAVLLPTLRADLTLVNSFRFHPADRLEMRIRAFAGVDDVEGSPERMSGWRLETRGHFSLDIIPGGHFFDAAGELRVIRTIAHDLAGEADSCRTGKYHTTQKLSRETAPMGVAR
jgi:medium-chain acyl-[acyl-carrier-protein] hydrolase